MNPLTYIVPPEKEGYTVLNILRFEFEMSRSYISRLKRRGNAILKNGEGVYVTSRLKSGDTVTALICDEDTKKPTPIPFPLDIVYEDEWLLIVNKPAGITVHPERDGAGSSVENALAAVLAADEYVHIVNRLDRGTSGLMAIAKCGYMHQRLKELLHTDDFYKEYIGVSIGRIEPERGVVNLPLGHTPMSSYKMAVVKGGAESVTEYEVICYIDGEIPMTKVRLIPHTGRMHQLRVHMAAIGYPLVGDWLYGKEEQRISRPALHSCKIRLKHPLTGEYVEAYQALPSDILSLL